MRFDEMDSVAVGAYRRGPIAAGDRLAVYAAAEFGCYALMAESARSGHIELENARLGICGRADVVTAVTVGADGGVRVACCHGPAVDSFLVPDERLITDAAPFHYELLPVAGSAGCRNLAPGSLGQRIGRTQYPMRLTVAVHTRGSFDVPVLRGAGVQALLIDVVGSAMAIGAAHWSRERRMGISTNVAMTTGAVERPVDRVPEALFVDRKA
jgi:hypothetical protein